MREQLREFWSDERAAVAPTIALALVGLISAGGIAFDYARMASLDTELQQAADQAALAAASQLDGETGARSRATSAAQNLVTNLTYFANDGSGTAVAIETPVYYSDYDPATGDKDPVATSDANARFVEVSVVARTANYALTPIVALFSATMDANAFAGIGSAICNVPPVMICNPAEGTASTFNALAPPGTGLELVAVQGSGPWVPGNFGYLDSGNTSNGAPGLRQALGWNTVPGDCSPQTGVDTEPGATVTATDAINTRFDISDNVSCPNGGTCSPARNIRTDLVRPQTGSTGGNTCKLHNQGWQLPDDPYLPDSLTPLTSDYPETMGHPRDICHALDDSHADRCGQVGTGVWDWDAYFLVNYGWNRATWESNTGLSVNAATGKGPSRFQVYQWELTQYPLGTRTASTGPNMIAHGAPICSAPLPADSTTPDRRRISAALINCNAAGVSGNSTNVPVIDWIDLFLVEPSLNRDRTHQGDVYVEVIGSTPSGSNGQVIGQVIRRDVPRLIE